MIKLTKYMYMYIEYLSESDWIIKLTYIYFKFFFYDLGLEAELEHFILRDV